MAGWSGRNLFWVALFTLFLGESPRLYCDEVLNTPHFKLPSESSGHIPQGRQKSDKLSIELGDQVEFEVENALKYEIVEWPNQNLVIDCYGVLPVLQIWDKQGEELRDVPLGPEHCDQLLQHIKSHRKESRRVCLQLEGDNVLFNREGESCPVNESAVLPATQAELDGDLDHDIEALEEIENPDFTQ